MKKRILIIGFFLTFCSCGLSAKSSELKFNVKSQIPENQIDKTQTYFDLKMSPNMSQDIYIEVTNHSNEDIIVVPSISNATTNMNGVVEYMKSKNNVNKDTPLEIEKVVRIDKKQKELKISKGKSQQLKLAITLPKEEFKGIIAGGITLQEKIADESESNKKKNLKIENLHAYTIALVIREDVKELIPNLEFKEVKAGQSNYRNVIFTELINPVSNYVNNLEIKTKIFNKEKKEIYFTE